MAKKSKVSSPAGPATPAGETTPSNVVPGPGATPAAPKAKKTKTPKVEVPLTDAQKAAKAALEKANQEAQAELVANSAEKIKAADEKIVNLTKQLAEARAERKALNKALGIKGVFGGKRANTLFFAQDFPEGKGAPQARAILEIVKAGGKAGVAREKVVETMKTAIQTNMDRSRLLSFYTSRMVEAGVITVE